MDRDVHNVFTEMVFWVKITYSFPKVLYIYTKVHYILQPQFVQFPAES